MKEKLKSFFVNVILVSIISYGIVYGANITSTTQTAVTGDTITADWVNDVNTKLNNLSTGGPGTVVAGCWTSTQVGGTCWGGASRTISPTCPTGSTARGVGWVYDGSEVSNVIMGSFICVKN